VHNILFLTPDLDYRGASTRLGLLARGLPRERFNVRVAVWEKEGAGVHDIVAAGVPVDLLGSTRVVDPRAFARLWRAIRAVRPNVLHVCNPAAMPYATLAAVLLRKRAGVRPPPAVVVSGPFTLPGRNNPSRLVPWCLRRADRVVAATSDEAAYCRRHGVAGPRTATIPPATADPPAAAPDGLPIALPPGARVLLGIGPLERHKGFRDAIWAFDILKFLYDDLHLVLVGDGPDRGRLELFAREIGALDRVHFAGHQAEVSAWLRRAEVVLVPGRTGGLNAALEAMAAGRPVVAARVPELAEVVADGATGFLTPPEDKVALARNIRRLVDDDALRQRLGAAGRQRVLEQFSAPALVSRHAALYEEALGG
jgi:glycosyltransferase involved in cell wall biosynthesis